MESFLSFEYTENFRKKLLLRNLKPYKVDNNFSADYNVREIILVDYAVKDSPEVREEQKKQESKLIGLNKYGPSEGFGEIININKNLGTESNQGNYTLDKTVSSSLEKIGNSRESLLYTKNIWGPTIFQSSYGPTVIINKDTQTQTNKGEYGITKTVNSALETKGDTQENILRVLNKYNPENVTLGFGVSVDINVNKGTESNFGEYNYVSNGPNKPASQSQLDAYLLNPYGPENNNNGYGEDIDPFAPPFTPSRQITNLGEYDHSTFLEKPTEQSRIEAYLYNRYGPENLENGFGITPVDPTLNLNTTTNQGEYEYTTSTPPKTNEEQQNTAYLKNIYNTGDGSYEVAEIEDIQKLTKNAPYANSDSTFIFIKSDYTPISILKNDDPQGSEGNLSQDSLIAQLGAAQLKKEFRARIAFNLLQETLGKSNLTESSIEPTTGQISVAPKVDPFLAIGVVAGKVPIINKDFKVTTLPSITQAVTQQLFETRLTGAYLPVSPIIGNYFDYPQKNFLTQAVENPVALVAGTIANLATKILTPFIDSGSELFLQYTSAPTKQLLFDQLFYNEFRPQYRFDSLLSPNILAPSSKFYVGTTKNFIKNAVSPVTDIAKGKFEKPNIGPVFSYGEIGKEYEGSQLTNYLFGLKAKSFYDSVGLQGGFTWTAKDGFFQPGRLVGPEGKKFEKISTFDVQSQSDFNKTRSKDLTFTDGSILDITQKLVDAGNNSTRKLEHVGNAINQVSKVFNDGYTELTKGSRVIRYETPTSKKNGNAPLTDVVGYEYCRLFTKDSPYSSYSRLQKRGGMWRKGNTSSYSVLDNTYNLNIAPMGALDRLSSTNLNVNGQKVKKYMFSLENLAWRTSNRIGYRVEDLPDCEVGPNGGRIMWFPPYDLSFDETNRAKFQGTEFLGRVEPVYSYQGSERTGSISFKIVVDHPSVLNTLIQKELNNVGSNHEVTKIIDSFFAGCLQYDPYELLKKYKVFSLTDILEVTDYLRTREDYQKIKQELPQTNTDQTITTNTNPTTESSGSDVVSSASTATTASTSTVQVSEAQKQEFEEILLFFDQSIPKPIDSGKESAFKSYYSSYKSLKGTYTTKFSNKLVKYAPDPPTEIPITQNFSYNEYVDTRKNQANLTFDFFEKEYNSFETNFLPTVQKLLEAGKDVSFELQGAANSSGSVGSNSDLSKRRIKSVLKQILDYKGSGSNTLKTFYDSGKLKIDEVPLGDTANLNEKNYNDVSCEKEFRSSVADGTYSVQAMLCRRVKITKFNFTPDSPDSTNASTTTPNTDANEGVLNPTAGQDGSNVSPPSASLPENFSTQTTEIKDKTNQLRKKLTKKLFRQLFSECTYFQMIQESDPIVYNGIKEKLKHFHPAFHSITPEGLNSRLTFLNQCMAPGDTIPTAINVGGNVSLAYNDVYNSAFGAPPILVLRVGDFFHTKIVPETLTLKYSDAKFDLNPEGIGVQPMIAEVTLGFKFIGGHGLAEPVARLNNALSFNWYANTEIYDERATETDDFTSRLDKNVLDDIDLNSVGILKQGDDKDTNDSGNPIGTVENTYFDPNTNQTVGFINYKEKMNTMLKNSKELLSNIKNALFDISDLRWGGLIYFTADREYFSGKVDLLGTPSPTEIFGQSTKYQEKVEKLFQDAKQDIDNDQNPIFANFQFTNLKEVDRKKVKRKLKSKLDIIKDNWISRFTEQNNTIVQGQSPYVQIMDQMNFILSNNDGFTNKKGGLIMYSVSSTTEVAKTTSSNGQTNTYDELKNDLITVGDGFQDFIDLLKEKQIIPDGANNVYDDNYNFNLYLPVNKDKFYKRFFMTLGNTIVGSESDGGNDIEFLVNDLVEDLSNDKKEEWKKFIYTNIGWNYTNSQVTKSNDASKPRYIFEESFKTLDKNKKDFEVEFDNKYSDITFKPYEENKIRRFTLTKQDNINPTTEDNFYNLWSSINSSDELFNLKFKPN